MVDKCLIYKASGFGLAEETPISDTYSVGIEIVMYRGGHDRSICTYVVRNEVVYDGQ